MQDRPFSPSFDDDSDAVDGSPMDDFTVGEAASEATESVVGAGGLASSDVSRRNAPGGPDSFGVNRVRPEDGQISDSADEPEPAVAPAPARSSVLEALVLVLLALVLALTLKTYVAEAYEIKGRSMVPTFANGERVVVLKLFYEIERGDIVIFASNDDATKDLIKRVVALPGEHIRIERGEVFVNGEIVEESYLGEFKGRGTDAPIEETLGPDEYYVLGDNRDDSHDSRRFGPVSAAKLKGKVVIRWWPFHGVRTF